VVVFRCTSFCIALLLPTVIGCGGGLWWESNVACVLAGGDNVKIVLVGNKADLEGRRAVAQEDAQAYAEQNGFLFFEVSAKSGDGVQELFVKASLASADTAADSRRKTPGPNQTVNLDPADGPAPGAQARGAAGKKSCSGGCGM